MSDTLRVTRRRSERGEGNGKLILALAVFIYCAYVAFVNVPIYLNIVNVRHDITELARSAGAQSYSIPRVNKALEDLIYKKYDVASSEITVKKDGPTLTITYDTERTINFIFYKYRWIIHHVAEGKAM